MLFVNLGFVLQIWLLIRKLNLGFYVLREKIVIDILFLIIV